MRPGILWGAHVRWPGAQKESLDLSVISFEEWKQKKARSSALTSRGALREDVALQEAYGFDLCVYIAEESAQMHPDSTRLDQLWADLRNLTAQLPQEHGYFYFRAFEAFQEEDLAGFSEQFELYLDSEKRIFHEIVGCDWWIDCLVWVFTPPMDGMYGKLSQLFFKYWPDCAMGWVCLALEQGGLEGSSGEVSLMLLHTALEQDPKCYLAHYLIASIYYEQGLWKSALPYFGRASESAMYKEDAAFYFDYAWACEKADKLDAAANFYQSALALDESYPSTLNNLGCVQMKQGRYDEALKSFYQAIMLGKDGPLPYRNVVSVLEKQGRHRESKVFIQQHQEELGPQYAAMLELAESVEGMDALRKMTGALTTEGSGIEGGRKRMIEDDLEERILQGDRVFDRELQIVEDEGGYGRGYYIPDGGCVDLLAYAPKGREYLLVDCCPGEADERHLILLWHKMQAFSSMDGVAPRPDAKVSGVLLCGGASPSLQSRLKQVNNLSVEVYRYTLELTKLKS